MKTITFDHIMYDFVSKESTVKVILRDGGEVIESYIAPGLYERDSLKSITYFFMGIIDPCTNSLSDEDDEEIFKILNNYINEVLFLSMCSNSIMPSVEIDDYKVVDDSIYSISCSDSCFNEIRHWVNFTRWFSTRKQLIGC